jgi:hypothetical protein
MEENDLDCLQNFHNSQQIDDFYNPGYKKKKFPNQTVISVKKSGVIGKPALPSKRTIQGLTLPIFAGRKQSVKPKTKKVKGVNGKEGAKVAKKTVIKVAMHMVRGEAS